MDAIVTKMEETLERKKSITNIVEKRTMVIDYIRRIHEAAYYGNSGFSNTPSISSLSLNDTTTTNNNNTNNINNNCNNGNNANNSNNITAQSSNSSFNINNNNNNSNNDDDGDDDDDNNNNNNNINNNNNNNKNNNNYNNNSKLNVNGNNSNNSGTNVSTAATNNNNNNIATSTSTNNMTASTSGLSTSTSVSSISSLSNSSNNLNKLYSGAGAMAAVGQHIEPNPYSSQQNMHWMNVTMIQRQDFEKSQEIQKRLLGWFCLGFSLAPLIATDKGPAYIRSLVQLMEEYDYHFELGSAMQGVKVLLSKKQPTHTVVNENEHIKSKIVKIGTTVVYEFLKIFNISIAKDLDYFQVVFSLLEILEQIYKKIDKETCSSKYVYEALLKVDSRLKHNIFGFLSKEIDKMSMAIIKEQLDFTLLSTSIKDKDIQQHLNIQSKLANSLNISQNGGGGGGNNSTGSSGIKDKESLTNANGNGSFSD
ncbi:hypothetical protein ACTFIU_004983 [Dictyostelium citrinum]